VTERKDTNVVLSKMV